MIQLSKNLEYFAFYTRRSKDEIKWVLEADPEFLTKQKLEEHRAIHGRLMRKQTLNKTGIEDPDIFNKKSSASTYISNIQNIIFGGINSRFWMLRKHFNSMQ